MDDFKKRAKDAEDQVIALEAALQSVIQEKCKQYRYEVLYYGFKNRGNFARLLFTEAGIPYKDVTDRKKLMTYFKCQNQLSQDNAKKLSFQLMAPPAVVRYPVANSRGDIFSVSQTVSIYQYLSSEFNLRPVSDDDNYLSMNIVANCNDILSEIFNHRNDKYEELNAFYNKRIQIWLDILEKPLTKSATQEYYFDNRCLAVDLCVFNICDGILEIMEMRKKELFIDTHSVLYNHYKRIKMRDNINKLINKQNNVLKWTWWPIQYGFGDVIDRLNRRGNTYKLAAADNDDKKTSTSKVGGWGKPADKDEMTDAINGVKSDVEKEAKKQNIAPFTCYEPVEGEKQVVAGINYKIKVKIGDNRYCDVIVYRTLPPFKYELKSVTFQKAAAKKLVGGFGKAATKDEMTKAINGVKADIEKEAKDQDIPAFTCYEAVEGQKQVVAGMNYRIKMKIGDNRYCNAVIFQSLPPVSYELKSVKFDKPVAKSKLGGKKDADADDFKELIEAANSARRQVEATANISSKPISCYTVVSGTKQVVAGMNFQIKVKIGDNRYCNLEIYRSLPPFKYETKKTTFNPPLRVAKVGGWKTADIQDITAAANSVKDEVEKQRINDKKPKFDSYKAVSGETQTVAGTNYKIKVKIGKKRFCQIHVFRTLFPFKCSLKKVIW